MGIKFPLLWNSKHENRSFLYQKVEQIQEIATIGVIFNHRNKYALCFKMRTDD